MAHSVRLTAYQPRWGFSFSAHLPNILEKSLMYTFHVSLTLALLNSLPVISCHFKFCFKCLSSVAFVCTRGVGLVAHYALMHVNINKISISTSMES